MRHICGALVLASALWGGTVEGQSPNYLLYFTPGLTGPSGSTLEVSCFLNVLPAGGALQGWSFSVCHNYLQIQPLSAEAGSTTQTVQNGGPPDFLSQTWFAGNSIDTGGVTQGVVIDFFNQVTLPPGPGYHLQTIEYNLSAANGTVSTINYCNTAEIPNQPAVTTVMVVSGNSIVPSQQPGPIEIEIIPFVLELDSVGPIEQSESATVPIFLTNTLPVYGFSFGVTHNAAALDVTAVSQGPVLAALSGGQGAEFFATNLSPAGGTGFTLGCVFSLDSLLTIPPGANLEIVAADYDVLSSAPLGISPLSFTNTLSPPAPAPPVAVAISIGNGSVIPTQIGGSVTVIEGQFGLEFIRGNATDDATVNITDPVFLLDYLFSGGPTPHCLDSGDMTDDGQMNVSDPVYLLTYLFGGGPPPAAPHQVCGIDPSGDADGITCLQSSACP